MPPLRTVTDDLLSSSSVEEGAVAAPQTTSVAGPECPLKTLLATALSSSNLRGFNLFLHEHSSDGTGLKAHSCFKGLVSIISAVRKLCGGRRLSLLEGELRRCAEQVIDCAQDAMSSWSHKAVLAKNAFESTRLVDSLSTCRPSADRYLSNLYQFFVVHKFQYFAKFANLAHDEVLTSSDLKAAVGFVNLALSLARPSTRAGVFASATASQVQTRLLAQPLDLDSEMALAFEDHKTSTSFGSLFCLLPAWILPILVVYVTKLRRRVLSLPEFFQRTTSPSALLFPANFDVCLAFLLKSFPGSPTQSQIRSWFAEVVGSTQHCPVWGTHVPTLVKTFAHESSVATRHYHVTSKAQTERLVSKFVSERFLQPAEDTALRILNRPAMPIFLLASSVNALLLPPAPALSAAGAGAGAPALKRKRTAPELMPPAGVGAATDLSAAEAGAGACAVKGKRTAPELMTPAGVGGGVDADGSADDTPSPVVKRKRGCARASIGEITASEAVSQPLNAADSSAPGSTPQQCRNRLRQKK